MKTNNNNFIVHIQSHETNELWIPFRANEAKRQCSFWHRGPFTKVIQILAIGSLANTSSTNSWGIKLHKYGSITFKWSSRKCLDVSILFLFVFPTRRDSLFLNPRGQVYCPSQTKMNIGVVERLILECPITRESHGMCWFYSFNTTCK